MNYLKVQKKRIPGGVNSPVRAYQAVGRNPVFIKKAKGSHIFDEDGNDILIMSAPGDRVF